MYTPNRDEFLKLAQPGKVAPVFRLLMGDILTPVLAFFRLRGGEQAFLLESVTGGEKIGRYSFLGINPSVIFKASGKQVQIAEKGSVREIEQTDPLREMKTLLDTYQPVTLPGLPRFSGGAVGYFSYDVIRQVENLPNPPARSLNLPDIYFGIYTTMLIFDHAKKTCAVLAYADCREDDPATAYDIACAKVDGIIAQLGAPGALPVEEVPALPENEPEISSNFERKDFERAVEKCKEYIRAGDIFQVVLSQRLSTPCSADPFEVYRNIRVINPSPYMFYLKYPDFSLVGSSPEVMVRVEERNITVRPIAGTRPRGKNEAEDQALAEDLLADPKECAEHTMLLDLGRNDVGRVAEYGSVKITEKMVIENYSHVMHIVSNVVGKQRAELTAFDTFKSCLPAGTVSGAPKVRAMEIIDEVEPDVRGPYGGAVGYIDFSGNLDTCITLRTILLLGGVAHVQAGAGIVADSVPEMEYEETRNKARALLKAIQVSQPGKGRT
jgi:anthranilate synthase component 1